MAFKLKQIKAKLVEGDFEYEGQTLHVTVDANALTGRAMDSINGEMAERVKVVTGLEQQTAQIHALSAMLAKIITKWDAEDGQPNVETFLDQPIGFLSDLLEFAMGLVAPKAKTASV
jgi:hypothetical protein